MDDPYQTGSWVSTQMGYNGMSNTMDGHLMQHDMNGQANRHMNQHVGLQGLVNHQMEQQIGHQHQTENGWPQAQGMHMLSGAAGGRPAERESRETCATRYNIQVPALTVV